MKLSYICLFIVIIGLFALSFATAVTPYYTKDPSTCPEQDQIIFPGTNCHPINLCGNVLGIAQCYDTTAIIMPSVYNPSYQGQVASGLGSGYVLDCYNPDTCVDSFWCSTNSSCNTWHRTTVCNSTTVTNCNGCMTDYFDCDLDPDDCEVHQGDACILGGLPGTYNGCDCIVGRQHFITGLNAQYSSNLSAGESLLWGTEWGEAMLMNLTSLNSSSHIYINNSACIIFNDNSYLCNATISGGGNSFNGSHHNLTDLIDGDDHSQYVYIYGRNTGQIVFMGNNSIDASYIKGWDDSSAPFVSFVGNNILVSSDNGVNGNGITTLLSSHQVTFEAQKNLSDGFAFRNFDYPDALIVGSGSQPIDIGTLTNPFQDFYFNGYGYVQRIYGGTDQGDALYLMASSGGTTPNGGGSIALISQDGLGEINGLGMDGGNVVTYTGDGDVGTTDNGGKGGIILNWLGNGGDTNTSSKTGGIGGYYIFHGGTGGGNTGNGGNGGYYQITAGNGGDSISEIAGSGGDITLIGGNAGTGNISNHGGDIFLIPGLGTPNGTVKVNGVLSIRDSNKIYYTSFIGNNQSTNVTYVLPNSTGDVGQVLTDNGSGYLSWKTVNINANITESDPYWSSNLTNGVTIFDINNKLRIKSTAPIAPNVYSIFEGQANLYNIHYHLPIIFPLPTGQFLYGAFSPIGSNSTYKNVTLSWETAITSESDPIFVAQNSSLIHIWNGSWITTNIGNYSAENSTIVRAGNYNCPSGQYTQNATINSSGIFLSCSTPTGDNPTGMLAPFYLNACPSEWIICDGTTSCPNLTGRFIIANSSTYVYNSTGGSTSYTPSGTIGSMAGTTYNVNIPAGKGTFTGTPATIIPPYYSLIYCMKT